MRLEPAGARRAPDARSRATSTSTRSCATSRCADVDRRAPHGRASLDPLDGRDVDRRAPDDGLPVALDEVIARYGNRYFKIKLGGDVDADVARLTRIAAVLDRAAALRRDARRQRAVRRRRRGRALWRAMRATRALARLVAVGALPRAAAAARSDARRPTSHALARDVPLLIDESDATLDAFPRRAALRLHAACRARAARASTRSLLNAARCARWNARTRRAAFMSGEDLTAQAGLAVQQDLALAGAARPHARRAQRPSLRRRLRRAGRRRAPSRRRSSPRIPTCTRDGPRRRAPRDSRRRDRARLARRARLRVARRARLRHR